nr:LCP family protein [Allorhizocola rhizosphaerae]
MRWVAAVGGVLMILSGAALAAVDLVIARYNVATADLFGEPSEKPVPLQGPLNVLLVGIDPRTEEEVPRADSVMVVHVGPELDKAYVFSLPRDLLVSIPPFPKSGFGGAARDRLAHAMFHGAQVESGPPDVAKGFELLAQTVSGVTGIGRFDAGAIVDFGGFERVIDALGGVEMVVDQEVRSLHLRPDGTERDPAPVGYTGPQKVYEVGTHHFQGWEALDFARQRYIEGGDYARQRHQQQLVRAMLSKAFSAEVVTKPAQVDRVLRAAGKSLLFSGRGLSLADWALALRHVKPESLLLIHLAGGGVTDSAGEYLGEALDATALGFVEAVVDGRVGGYVVQHPELISQWH